MSKSEIGPGEARTKKRMSAQVFAKAESEGAQAVVVSAAIEAELIAMPEEDRAEYLEALGLEESGLARVIRAGYKLLGLQTFFTAGPKESRAWRRRNRVSRAIPRGRNIRCSPDISWQRWERSWARHCWRFRCGSPRPFLNCVVAHRIWLNLLEKRPQWFAIIAMVSGIVSQPISERAARMPS